MNENIKNLYSNVVSNLQVQRGAIEKTIEQEVQNEMRNRIDNIIAPYEKKVVAKANEAIANLNEEKAKEIQAIENKYTNLCDGVRSKANDNINNKKMEEEASVRYGVGAKYQPQIVEIDKEIAFLSKHIDQ